jgi:PAS domain S-box-containing protein
MRPSRSGSKLAESPHSSRTVGTDADARALSPGGIDHEAGDLHRLLVESVRDYAIFALDPRGYILSWNAGAERFKGYTADQIIGKHFSVFYPPEDIAAGKPERELDIAVREGHVEDEGWRIRRDGTRFWANVVITALRDAEGRLLGFAKVTRDLTERRRAEEAVRLSEERFRLLVDSVKDYAIFMLDPAGYITTWNEGAQRIKGYTPDQIIGKHFSTFYTPEDLAADKPRRELEIAAREGRYEEEGWRVRRDGSHFWANVLITAIRNDSQRLLGFAKVTRDLTERRRATELEQRSREAEAANRIKAEFLAAMSHELRTPLNAIGGYAQLIEMGVAGPVTEQQREQLDRIQRSQQHLLRVINDILNFSRVEAGEVEYYIAPVPMRDVLDAVTPLVAPQAEAKGLNLETIACPLGLTAEADRAKVEQIVVNLLSNAVKFTAAGGAVTLFCSDSPDRVLVHVRDTGIGIPADQLERIFEPFVQIGRTLASPKEGAGLGLAISRDLARAMHGDLTVESREGAGSTFTLSLPRAAHQTA